MRSLSGEYGVCSVQEAGKNIHINCRVDIKVRGRGGGGGGGLVRKVDVAPES